MADIKKELNDIKNAVYGREVRGSIHDGIKKINEESEKSKEKADEAHDVMESIIEEGFDNAALEANFEQKLDDKIANLQPEWTGFKEDITTQLADTVIKINDLGINVDNYSSIQDAIDSIQYGRINLPSKVYEINKPIKIDANNIELTGVGSAVIKKSDNFVGDSLIKSLYEDRTNGSLENVIFKNLRLDGVDSSVNGIELSRLTRGSKIENVFVENANDGIRLSDSWSIQLIGNNIINCTDSGIKLSGSINALTIMGNTARHSNVGLKTYNIRGSAIIGNTFELNDTNAQFAGVGNKISGNYFELPNKENVKLGSSAVSFSSNDFSGNFFNNAGDSKSAVYLINTSTNVFGVNHYVNIIYMYYLTNSSIVEGNEFHIPQNDVTPFRKEETSSTFGHVLGRDNSVFRGSDKVNNIPDTGQDGSVATWRINTPDQNNFIRVGKLNSNSNEFGFISNMPGFSFRFYNQVRFDSGIGFFGSSPKQQYSISGDSAEDKLNSLIHALRGYGLIE